MSLCGLLKVVWFFIKHVGRPATLLQGNQDNADESFSGGTNLPVQSHFIGMESVRQSLVECGIFDRSCRRHSVGVEKKVRLSNIMCTSRNGPRFVCQDSHFMRASISLILVFRHDLYIKGYGYSSLNTVRSAIYALYSIDKTDIGQNIGKHPLICRFLEDVFNEIPPTPKFQEVWPVQQVLLC